MTTYLTVFSHNISDLEMDIPDIGNSTVFSGNIRLDSFGKRGLPYDECCPKARTCLFIVTLMLCDNDLELFILIFEINNLRQKASEVIIF